MSNTIVYLGKIALDFMACIELELEKKEGNNRGAARRSMDESVECSKMPLIPYYLGEKCNGQRIARDHPKMMSHTRGGWVVQKHDNSTNRLRE